jgi:hypothetical protein
MRQQKNCGMFEGVKARFKDLDKAAHNADQESISSTF